MKLSSIGNIEKGEGGFIDLNFEAPNTIGLSEIILANLRSNDQKKQEIAIFSISNLSVSLH